MDLEDLDIKGIIISMPDPSHFIMRLASQEIDKLASVLYEGLKNGAQIASQKGLKDPESVHKAFYSAIIDQLSSIEGDLAVKNLAEKINMEFILEKILT